MITRRRLLGGGAALAGSLLMAGCAGDDEPRAEPDRDDETPPDSTTPSTTTAGEDRYFPSGSEWETVDPAEAGWDPAALEELATFLETNRSRTAILLSGGRIVAEHHWAGATAETPQDIASVQKSVVSTLCGIAVDRGLLAVDDRVSDHLPAGWTAADPADEARITVEHLLTMSSGLDQNTLTQVAEPGTTWAYNTTAYQKLRPVLESVSGAGIDELSREWLWTPIGASTGTRWVERAGDGPLQVDATGARLWSLQMTARDMARFGLLVQRAGKWEGEPVVSGEWLDAATAGSEVEPTYGYLWWLASGVEATGDGPDLPEDLVAALGANDQKVYVVPSLDLAFTRQGLSAGPVSESRSNFDLEILDRLLAART
jgi:CubicO group peptidase (beta-lactamase class C family)